MAGGARWLGEQLGRGLRSAVLFPAKELMLSTAEPWVILRFPLVCRHRSSRPIAVHLSILSVPLRVAHT